MFNPLITPSSILPTLSGTYLTDRGLGDEQPSVGFVTLEEKNQLLSEGSGIRDGNFADWLQHRDLNKQAALQEIQGGPDEILGKPLADFPDAEAGINKRYPSPASYKYGNAGIGGPLYGQSGIIISRPPKGNEFDVELMRDNEHPEAVNYFGSKGTGIFNFKEFLSKFSNGEESKSATIDDFTIFNDYIHYLTYEEQEGTGVGEEGNTIPLDDADVAVKVPFVSDLIPTTNVWDRYGDSNLEEDENEDTDPSYGN